MILVVDNYDSFTYNLVQCIGELGADPEVHRNDALRVDDGRNGAVRGVIISPGPGRPEDAGVSVELVRRWSGSVPILGVCLGHQAVGAAFGAVIGRVHPLHGKASAVRHAGSGILRGVDDPFPAGRYHSLVVESRGLPRELDVIARSEEGLIMGLRHREHVTWGVQFHPESILTPDGRRLLRNFLEDCGEVEP